MMNAAEDNRSRLLCCCVNYVSDFLHIVLLFIIDTAMPLCLVPIKADNGKSALGKDRRIIRTNSFFKWANKTKNKQTNKKKKQC